MDILQTHLQHLLWLLSPPYSQGWKLYVWSRAQELAKDAELAELPRLLTEAMQSQAQPKEPPAP